MRNKRKKKYILTDREKRFEYGGELIKVYQIQATESFDVYGLKFQMFYDNTAGIAYIRPAIYLSHIQPNQLGGYVGSRDNLDENDSAWIEKGIVFGKAKVKNNGWVGGKYTVITGEVEICDSSKVILFEEDENIKQYKKHLTIDGKIGLYGNTKVFAPIKGEGLLKNAVIDKPSVLRTNYPKTIKKPEPIVPQKKLVLPGTIPVSVECTVGDKKVVSQFYV